MTEKQEIDSRIEEIKWDDKSKFKEALDEKKILCFNNNISSNCLDTDIILPFLCGISQVTHNTLP